MTRGRAIFGSGPGEAVMTKIKENPTAAKTLTVTKSPLLAATSSNAPDPSQP